MKSSLARLFSLILVAVIAFVAVIALRFWQGGLSWRSLWHGSDRHVPESYTLPEKPPLQLNDVDVLARLNDEYAKLTHAVVPAVVSIDTSGVKTQRVMDFWGRSWLQRQPTQGQGSGVIVTKEGHIITNEHVISGQQQIRVTLHDGKTYTATLVGEDPMLDIAVLKIAGDGEFVPLKLGDSSQVRVGQLVFAVGNPFGLSETVTQGIISAKERSISDQQRDLFQTDAAINPGNSGGPLVNMQGEIVGINVAIYSPNKENPGFQGVGFSIPSNDVREALVQILERGRPVRGFLGVQLRDLDEQLREQLGLSEEGGSLITEVVTGSPAEKAGLLVNDVVMEFDGQPLSSSQQLFSMVQRSSIGKQVVIKVWRNGEIVDLQATVGENTSAAAPAKSPRTQQEKNAELKDVLQRCGIRVRDFTTAEQSRGLSGVRVTALLAGSLGKGVLNLQDIVVAVNQNPISNAEDFYHQLAASAPVQETQITLVREGRPLQVVLPQLR